MPVSLDNLHKIGQLKPHPPDRDEIERLLAAATRGITDVASVTACVDEATLLLQEARGKVGRAT